MQSFEIEVWFRHGNDEKEHEFYNIIAETEQEAVEKAKLNHRWIISATIKSKVEV